MYMPRAKDSLTENVEMYLKVIYLIEVQRKTAAKTGVISEELNVAPPSVTEMLDRLYADGYVSYEKYRGVRTTAKGKAVAKRVLRKHFLIERFLTDTLGVEDPDVAHEQACSMEHVLIDDIAMRLSNIVKLPENPLGKDELETELCSKFLHPAKPKRHQRG